MRVIVIGAGVMGRNHIRVLNEMPSAELVGIVDQNLDLAQTLGDRVGASAFSDHRTALAATGAEAAVVAVPTVRHHAVVMDLIKSGIHVLVEKPIAQTVVQGKEMVAAAAEAGVALSVGHVERFNPAVIELKRRLDRGDLGQLFMIHSRRLSPYPRRIMDVGVAADLASHELDMMRYLVGSGGRVLGSAVSQRLHPSHEDIVFGLLRFENGALGILDVNWVTPTKIRDISVTGERGMFVVNYLSQELYFYSNSGAGESASEMSWLPGHDFTVDEGDMVRLHIARKEPLLSELEAFLDACVNGTRPVVDGSDGVAALSLSLDIVAKGNVQEPAYI